MRRRRRRSLRLFIYPLFLVGLLCLALSGVGLLSLLDEEGTPQTTTNPERLVYGLTLLPSGFDPHFNQSAELGIPFMSVYDTLVYRHPQTQTFEPGLAQSWTISPDGRTYTFILKAGVTFHDGEPLTASSIAVNFDRIMDPAFGSQRARALLGPSYRGYALVDDLTFQIQMDEPYAPLLDGLSQVYLGIASPLALANHTDGTYQWNQVGTGPYRVKEVVPGDRIVLERNPDYAWGPPFYATDNPAPLPEVEFRFFVDAATRDDALQSGLVGIVGELPPVDAELLLGNSAIRIYPEAIPGQPLQFIFNMQRSPTDDRSLRQALIHATNRVAIVDAIFAGQSPAAYGPLSAVTPFYNPEVSAYYPFSQAEAERLLSLARVTDSDEDGRLERDGQPLELEMLVPPWGYIPEVAQAIADQWDQLGITVNITQVPTFPALLEAIESGAFHLVAEYSFGTDADLLRDYFSSSGPKNWGGYADPQVDEWLLQAARALDDTQRAQLYGAAQESIMQAAAILPIRDYVNLNGASVELKGVIFSANGWWPLLPNFQWSD
ncbi:MAG: hypothetical protein HC915_09105 [Anaerolineae bacterium]|nr:hypothetical protein [Anaerolineae bacterium]